MTLLTAERLRELLHYDPETGVFTWLVSRGAGRTGSAAGYTNKRGYRRIQIDGRDYAANQIAWLYTTGSWPAEDVDHENLVRDDNRWENLRAASHAENMRNLPRPRHNTSGVKGVSWHRGGGKWQAAIQVNNSTLYLGLFTDIDAAAAAYAAASEKYHGEFGRVS